MANHPPNKNLKPHFVVEVEGTYRTVTESGDKVLKSYSLKIPVPAHAIATIPTRLYDAERMVFETVDKQVKVSIEEYGILSYLLRQSRIQNKLRSKDTGFIRVVTHTITNITPSDDSLELPTDPFVLNKSQLLRLIKSNGWKITVALFPTLKELRQAVINYKDCKGDEPAYKLYEDLKRKINAKGNALNEIQDELELYYAQFEEPANLQDPKKDPM